MLAIEGMGHDMPRPIWPRMIDAICDLAARADALKPRMNTNGHR